MNLKVVSLVGARPQIIKEAVVQEQLQKNGIQEILVHSGQHYDYDMSDVFFKVLKAGWRTNAQMNAGVMILFWQ